MSSQHALRFNHCSQFDNLVSQKISLKRSVLILRFVQACQQTDKFFYVFGTPACMRGRTLLFRKNGELGLKPKEIEKERRDC